MKPNHEMPRPTASEEQTSVAERKALVERIVTSEHFSRSERLRNFLRYVGEKSLQDSSSQIPEQEVGEKVFGRPSGYDCSQDNIVRVNASELRRRLDLYFATTGAEEPLLLEIPRGAYKPVFKLRPAESRPAPKPAAPATLAELSAHEAIHEPRLIPPAKDTRALQRLPWITLAVFLAALCAILAFRLRTAENALHPLRRQPALADFWSGFLNSSRETKVVLADSSLTLNDEITQHHVRLNEYVDHRYDGSTTASHLSPDRQQDIDHVSAHNLVTYGDVLAAQHLLMLDPSVGNLELTSARFFSAEALKHDSVVLIGGTKANPWVDLFDSELNFSLDQKDHGDALLIANRHPRTNEQAVYETSTATGELARYSIIAYLPNSGGAGKAIILAGTDSDATNAAAGFLTSEAQMEQLLKLFRTDRFPYFEVLLRCSVVRGTPLGAQIVAFRTYPDLH